MKRAIFFFTVASAMATVAAIAGRATIKTPSKTRYKALVFGSELKGVSISDYESAKAFQPAKEIEFRFLSHTVKENRFLLLEGKLLNHGDKERDVIVFPVHAVNPFHAEPVPLAG